MDDAEEDLSYNAETDGQQQASNPLGSLSEAVRADVRQRAEFHISEAKRGVSSLYRSGHIVDRPRDWICSGDIEDTLRFFQVNLLVWLPDVGAKRYLCST